MQMTRLNLLLYILYYVSGEKSQQVTKSIPYHIVLIKSVTSSVSVTMFSANIGEILDVECS